ncbi:ATP-binding protein [Sphingomonas sp.]|uniref:hybrid sensor histidine kinase/response regulator n=1 Tax=Sphingomonas sp. TaxID=28214 RepID=UPI002869FB96|nr:ATP-binding protein [Sphingomonas sp.]
MKYDRSSVWLFLLIAALPFFLFMSFRYAFVAQNEQRELQRRAYTDSQLIIARSDAVLSEALAVSKAFAVDEAIRSGNARTAVTQVRDLLAASTRFSGAALDDNQSQRRLFAEAGAGAVTGPYLLPGAYRVTLVKTPTCHCVVVSRGLVDSSGNPQTLHLYIPNTTFLRLLPVAQNQYAVSAIADRQGVFIARSLMDNERFGTIGSPHLRRASAALTRQGNYSGKTLEGVKNYTTFAGSDITDWKAHVALKAQRIDDPAMAFRVAIGVAVLLSLLLALLLYLVARRQIDSTRALTRRIQETQKLEALGQLTGGMAHDFNNLLTPIVGALDRLNRSPNLDVREKRFAKGALESAERAATLTSQLLSFSRRQKLEIIVVDIVRALEDVADLAGQSLEVRHMLNWSVEPGTPPIATDKVQFELAILNLILNARDSMPAGGMVEVRAARIDFKGQPWVAVSVTDSGSGMDADTLRRAQEPFFTTKPQGAGTGLGLAQVAEVARQSGGHVEIDSTLGQGTIVRMILPAAAAAAVSVSVPAAGRGRNLPGALKLLIVDDNADVRETLVQMVESDGHRVESVADGRTALAALSNRKPDLLLADFAMPGLSGADVIARANEIHPGLPCLLITGYWDSESLAVSGVTCPILRKPFTHDALRDAMAAALEV